MLHERDSRAHAALPVEQKKLVLWRFVLENGPDRVCTVGILPEPLEPPLQVSPGVLQKRLEFLLKQLDVFAELAQVIGIASQNSWRKRHR